jgi:3',5'-cyclic AMP phosphodiesterase CpdA
MYLYGHGHREEEKREPKKTQNMVSISWYLSENVRVEMSKTQHFEKFEKVICSELAAKVYSYMYIYGHGHREEAKRERRSFVDDGIPPGKVFCRSWFHRWNGHRHT